MANYPAFNQLVSSKPQPIDDVELTRAANGDVHGRADFSGVKWAFTVKHELNNTDLATLRSFYSANRLLSFTFVWQRDGTSYTCLFDGPPEESPHDKNFTQVTVKVVQQ
jgi:hypothetical protein